MKFLTRWFIDNPVATNLLMVMILAAGLLSFTHIRVESFPQMPANQLVISVAYPGGTAQQVDETITQRIEDSISSIPGILRINSVSYPGLANVRVRKRSGTELDRLIEDVRTNVNSIVGFPEQAERPQIYRDEFTNLAAFVQVFGDTSDKVLQALATRLETQLKRHPDISQVTNLGKRRPELVIEPYPEALRRYQLNLETLADRIQSWSLTYRSGNLKSDSGRLTLKADGYADNLNSLRNLPIINSADGWVRLEQLANVHRNFEEDDSLVRYQGQPAVALMVSTSSRDHLLKVSEAIQQVIVDMRPSLPHGVELDVMADMSPYIKEQLGLLSTSAWQGLLIILVLLGLFLNVRLAFWVALGIPVSIAGALWLMGLQKLDYSLNDITLFGMILVLGILVDDAVVVGESIHSSRQRIGNAKDAAFDGVERVAVPTVFGVLTTIAAFSPMLWIDNELAKLLAGFSAVVIFALIFSLIESKFILPCHLASSSSKPLAGFLENIQKRCNHGLDAFAQGIYLPLLRKALWHRYSALTLFICAMVLAYGLVSTGQIRSAFFPEIPGRYLTAKVTMQQDAPLALTVRNADLLETAVSEVNLSLQQEYQLANVPIQKLITSVDGPQALESTAELSAEALARIPGNRIIEHWQKLAGDLEGAYASQFSAADNIAGAVGISISHPERHLSKTIAEELKQALKNLSNQGYGINDIRDDAQGGQRQLTISVTPRGRQLGITQRQLALIVGGGFGGLELHRLLDHGEETRVMIRFGQEQRQSREALLNIPIHLNNGRTIPLREVAELKPSWEAEALYRRNRDIVVSVFWRQDRDIASPEYVLSVLKQQVIADLQARYPLAQISPIGEFQEISEVQTGFKKALLLTLLLIFALLAIPLKSYFQPLVIMSVIPFGFAGAIFGHGLMDLPVSVLSLFGMMAMTGVVVNDSLVLLSRYNQLREEGLELDQALLQAGRDRLRAIFLTTVTTVCGLLPLLLETSEQAQYLKPAAVSLVFGELFATPITLILIPLLIHIGADVKARFTPRPDIKQEVVSAK
ncbi:efflux RND transporter permease subunit [Maricurvus nonylphenolicus]|uniref:efflux RND transporter permease subunit n=1 Tax=Maricurvus nonylphenolicus TaxID=1008307 RepID=UPI0036F1D3AB